VAAHDLSIIVARSIHNRYTKLIEGIFTAPQEDCAIWEAVQLCELFSRWQMLYRLKSCQKMLRSGNHDSDAILYRGVSYSAAEKDLNNACLFFSQAISHNGSDNSQEGETFRTEREWKRVYQELELSEEDSTQSTHADFIEKGDQYARSCYFISCWSASETVAVRTFAYNHPDKAVMSIRKSDLIRAFQESVEYWNSQQPGEWDMLNSDGSQNLDWDPRYIGYVAGPVSYVSLDDRNNILPFRISRAMRLPCSSKDEHEWRIALDLSQVPSSISTNALLESGLMPSSLGELLYSAQAFSQVDSDSAQAELRPMIEISTNNYPRYERGLWLNHCDLLSQGGFRISKI